MTHPTDETPQPGEIIDLGPESIGPVSEDANPAASQPSASDNPSPYPAQAVGSNEKPPLGYFSYAVYGPNGFTQGSGTLGGFGSGFGPHSGASGGQPGAAGPGGPHPMPPFLPPQFWNQEFLAQAARNEMRLRAKQERTSYWRTPLILYVLTWLTTSLAGFYQFGADGLLFSFAIMTILTCHEMGHFLQTLRYRVRSSLPFFIPMPIGPFGTMGAIIRMDGRIPNMKALFDIGISGPLAGLIPTLFFCYYGILYSHIGPKIYDPTIPSFGNPLLFQWLVSWQFGSLPSGTMLYNHPFAFAGWVGLFLTSLNLLPIGQLDGGHVFYGLFGKKAGAYSTLFFYLLILLICVFQLWVWTLMLFLLAFMGTQHPPTQDDSVPIGFFRRLLGILTLAFILIGFTPNPVPLEEEPVGGHSCNFVVQTIGPSSLGE